MLNLFHGKASAILGLAITTRGLLDESGVRQLAKRLSHQDPSAPARARASRCPSTTHPRCKPRTAFITWWRSEPQNGSSSAAKDRKDRKDKALQTMECSPERSAHAHAEALVDLCVLCVLSWPTADFRLKQAAEPINRPNGWRGD